MGTTLQRQWLLLSMLPRPPRRIDAGAIERRLRERGIRIHRRTLQRDLVELAEIFPIVSDERTKPYGWRWADGAHVEALPSLRPGVGTPTLEITLRLRRASLEPVLEGLGVSNSRMPDASGDPMFVTVGITLEDSGCVRRLLLGFADDVEVVAPPSLRRDVAERARRALALHTG